MAIPRGNPQAGPYLLKAGQRRRAGTEPTSVGRSSHQMTCSQAISTDRDDCDSRSKYRLRLYDVAIIRLAPDGRSRLLLNLSGEAGLSTVRLRSVKILQSRAVSPANAGFGYMASRSAPRRESFFRRLSRDTSDRLQLRFCAVRPKAGRSPHRVVHVGCSSSRNHDSPIRYNLVPFPLPERSDLRRV